MKKFSCIFCILFVIFFEINAQNPGGFLRIDSLPASLALQMPWKYHKGDNMAWAAADLDDRDWQLLQTGFTHNEISPEEFNGIGWFRLHLHLDTTLLTQKLVMTMRQAGASEIYLDGKLLQRLGNVSKDPATEARFWSQGIIINLPPLSGNSHVLAVRYSNTTVHQHLRSSVSFDAGFTLYLKTQEVALRVDIDDRNIRVVVFASLSGMLIALGMLHLLIYFFHKSQRTNLYYSFFAACMAMAFLVQAVAIAWRNPDLRFLIGTLNMGGILLAQLFLLLMLYTLFYPERPARFTAFTVVVAAVLIGVHFSLWFEYLAYVYLVAACLEAIRITIKAITHKYPDSWIIGCGVIVFIILFVVLFICIRFLSMGNIFSEPAGIALICIDLLSIPVSMSVFLARNFARMNKVLSEQLEQVKLLSEKTIAQEKEKQHFLETQKEQLEIQVAHRTRELKEINEELNVMNEELNVTLELVHDQKSMIEKKNIDITDSIQYAQRIQTAVLGAPERIRQYLPDSFIFYRPRDIVSGDFYWMAQLPQLADAVPDIIVVAADCTGHGVPGAFMSLVGHAQLQKIIMEQQVTSPGRIIEELNKAVIRSLNQDHHHSESRDGMDIAIVRIDRAANKLYYAAANRPLYLVSNHELIEIKGDKQPVGGKSIARKQEHSQLHEIAFSPGDVFYLSSDGFADQFGGESDKKYMTKRFKQFLLSLHSHDMIAQHDLLQKEFEQWKGPTEQVDDVLVMGVRC